jgi:glycosyltransferase involved in cell wall biosynthesis
MNRSDYLKVSVIIPNYNRADLIGETIENFISQTLSPHEIIVVDDGSTDNSVSVINEFGSKVKLICQTNQGPGAARNAGLKVATGDYVQFFDSDDLCSLNKLEVQASLLERSGADIAYSPWVPAHIESRQVQIDKQVFQQRELPHNLNPLACFLRGWVSVFQALIFRRSFLQKVGFYRTDLMPSEDSEFLFRILLQQPVMKFCPDCLVLYRSHTSGQITGSGTSSIHRSQDWYNFIKIIDFYLVKHQIDLDYFTRFKFDCLKWKTVDYLSKLKPDYLDQDSDVINFVPIQQKLVFQIFDFFERLQSRVRTKIIGAGYSNSYGTEWIKPYQLKLIQDMGYSPSIVK